LTVAILLSGVMSCGKKEESPAVTTGSENVSTAETEESATVVTTVAETEDVITTDAADTDTAAVTSDEDEPTVVTTDITDDPEPVDTTAKSGPEPIVTTEPKKPIVEPAVSVIEEMAVGIGTKAVTFHPGDEEYEYILSVIKKRGDGQIFEALAYDYETVDELKRAAYYVELRFKNPIGVSITEHQGVTDYSDCREIVFILTGELNKCFVINGRSPMEGMKQDIALVEYVQKLVK